MTAKVDPKAVALQAIKIRTARAAERLIADEEASATFAAFPQSHTLQELIALDLPALDWSIEGLHARGMNTLLEAQYKTGKTTLFANLVKSLADEDDFLGHDTNPPPGRIAFWNYEMGDRMMQQWLEDLKIDNPERVQCLNLRGQRIPLYSPHVQQRTAEWLAHYEIDSWIIDPAVKAMAGWPGVESENSNTAVAQFLDVLDTIKAEAGVQDLYVAHHTGRAAAEVGEERGRGASRWDDWPDSRWLLVKKKDHSGDTPRFLFAEGRDISVPEFKLGYDDETRLLFAEEGSRQANRDMDDAFEVIYAVDRIGDGQNKTAVRNAIRHVAAERRGGAILLAKELGFIEEECATKGTGIVVNLKRKHETVDRYLRGVARDAFDAEKFDAD